MQYVCAMPALILKYIEQEFINQLLGPASGQLSSKSFLGQALVPSLDFFSFFLRFFDVDHF